MTLCYPIALSPSEMTSEQRPVMLKAGAVVCCHVFGVIEHSGIYVGDDCIIELHGSGLIRPVSRARFLAHRSGERIFCATNDIGQLIIETAAIDAAIAAIYHYREYHVFDNNCHQFVWQCISGAALEVADFMTLNQLLAQRVGHSIHWRQTQSHTVD
ncbi:MAG: hypothetical protein ACRCT7_14175 [Shewanella sp.]